MKVGKHTYGCENIRIHWGEYANLEIGSFCSIAKNLNIYLGGNHRIDWITTYPFGHTNKNTFNKFSGEGHPTSRGNVIIGNDVWIGDNVTIMSGVTIGNGCVIAANSHVVKDADPYSLIGGNPSKLIKYRFDKETINKLQLLRWWDFNDDLINEISPLLCSSDLPNLFKIFNL